MLATLLLLQCLSLPAPFSREAGAGSTWTSATELGFNGTGCSFTNCEINGTGADARVQLKVVGDWVRKNPQSSPAARTFHSMAALGNCDRLVLFGGNDGSDDLDDTWVYDAGDHRWSQQFPAQSPSIREIHSMATIFNDDKVLLFGGFYYDDYTWEIIFLNDTWVYDLGDNRWYDQAPGGAPSTRGAFGMAAVCGTDRVVLFGGMVDFDYYTGDYNLSNQTWVYDLGDNRWTLMLPPESPSGRYEPAVASVANDDKVVLFGGYDRQYDNETWVYDLSDNKWQRKSPPQSPSMRYGHGMATIYNDDRVMLFGGWTNGYSDETWVYDLEQDQWQPKSPTHKPPGRDFPAMASSVTSGRTILFGGDNANGYQSDTWFYDPSAYSQTGEYCSPVHDTGGPSYFNSICWTASLPPGTSLEFQLRLAGTETDLLLKNFTGPDGTPSSYYQSDNPIWYMQSGERLVQYRARFRTQNQSLTPSIEAVTIRYNRFPEAPVLLEPAQGIWVNTSHPTFRWEFNDTDSPSQSHYEWQLDASLDFESPEYTSREVSTNLTFHRPEDIINEGTWYWRARTADTEGDWGPFSQPRKMGVDVTSPLAFAPLASPAGWTNGRCEVSFYTSDNVSGVEEYRLWIDGAPFDVQASPFVLPELPDGMHNLLVRALDRAGNYADGKVRVYLDRTPPAPFTPTAVPPSWTSSPPQVLFLATDNASGMDHYEVKVDNGDFSIRASPYTLPELEEGEHTVVVRAFDRARNSREASLTVYIDKSQPEPLFLAVEPAGWTSADPTLTFDTADLTSAVDHYAVRVDTGDFTNRTSPCTLTGLSDGQHTVTVRAYDLAGNFAERSVTALVDKNPPEGFAPTAEPGNWTQADPKVSFYTTDNISATLTYKVGIDNGTFTKAKSPWTAAGLPDGQHLVTVRAYDEAGNFADGTVTVRIDRTPPANASLRINGGAGTTAEPVVRLAVAALDLDSGLDRICFSNDGRVYSDWEPFSPERNWTLSPGEGEKKVYLKIRDLAGNEAQASATINYQLPAQSSSQVPVLAISLIVIAMALAAMYGIYRYRSKKKRGQGPGARGQGPEARAVENAESGEGPGAKGKN